MGDSRKRACSPKGRNVNSRGCNARKWIAQIFPGPERAAQYIGQPKRSWLVGNCRMSTHTQIYYHIVFSTKGRVPALKVDRREDLFRYIWGIAKNHESHLYRINGT